MAGTSRSLISSLGLEDIINQRQREAEQLGRASALQGRVEAEKIKRRARGRAGTFQTIGALLGTAGGAVLGSAFGMPTQGASLGAKAGQKIGGAVSGVNPDISGNSAESQMITDGAGFVANFNSLLENKKNQQRQIEFQNRQQDFQERKFDEGLSFEKSKFENSKNQSSLNDEIKKVNLALSKQKLNKAKEKNKKQSGFQGTIDALDALEELSPQLTDTGLTIANTAINSLRGKLGDDAISAFETASILGAKQLATAFENGRLSDKDQEVYRSAIPDLGDTVQQRMSKTKMIKDLLIKAENTATGTYDSISVPQPEEDPNDLGGGFRIRSIRRK